MIAFVIVLALIGLFVVVVNHLESAYSLSSPVPELIAGVLVVVIIFVLIYWLYIISKRQTRVIATFDHPMFGKVSQRADSWESTLNDSPLGDAVIVMKCDSSEVTELDEAIFEEIINQHIAWKDEINSGFNELADELRPDLSSWFNVEAIILGDVVGEWTVCVSVPNDECEWGWTADFSEGKFVRLEQSH